MPFTPTGLIQVFQNRGNKCSVYNSVIFSLSENPGKTSEYTLAMISTAFNRISVWCSRETEWVVQEFLEDEKIMDINFYKGELYHVNMNGSVTCFMSGKRVNLIRLWHLEPRAWVGLVHLVEVNGALVIVSQEAEYFGEEKSDCERNAKPKCFKAWSFNVENGMMKKLSSLGNYALLWGRNSSFSVEACSSYGIKPNYVYNVGIYTGFIDMGVYELWPEKKIEDHYDPSYPRLSMVPSLRLY